jgi:hypothetical protein
MLNFVQGDLVPLTHTFVTPAGSPIDPATVRFTTYREADGVKATYDYSADSSSESNSDSDEPTGIVVRESTGVYRLYVDSSPMSGIWRWRVSSTGEGQAAAQDVFYVKPALIDDHSDSSSDDSSSS